MEKKYIACMVLHAVGDTTGFRNTEWEHMKISEEYRALEKLYEFIELGGVNGISLKGWLVSDDTLLHLKTANGLLTDYSSIDTLCNNTMKYYLEAYDQFIEEGVNLRSPGITTMNSLKNLKNGMKWNEIDYDFMAGGSGASMRGLCIGLAYYGKDKREMLTQIAIETSRITHNSVIGYLGCVASALFAALAIEAVNIEEWPFVLLDIIPIAEKYIKASGRGHEDFIRDSHIFIDKWRRYIDEKFDENKKIIVVKSSKNIVSRGFHYKENFAFGSNVSRLKGATRIHNVEIGSGGDDSVIIAYDCLLDSGDNWEKLVIYSMLHMGDTDTTGCIAAGLYGILYGLENIPKNFIKDLEYKEIIENTGIKLFKKFYKT